jgi:hypothetical protein
MSAYDRARPALEMEADVLLHVTQKQVAAIAAKARFGP